MFSFLKLIMHHLQLWKLKKRWKINTTFLHYFFIYKKNTCLKWLIICAYHNVNIAQTPILSRETAEYVFTVDIYFRMWWNNLLFVPQWENFSVPISIKWNNRNIHLNKQWTLKNKIKVLLDERYVFEKRI